MATIGEDARVEAAQRALAANAGFRNSAVINLSFQATERAELAAYFESIKPNIRTIVVGTGRYRGEFTLRHGLKRTTGLPPPPPLRLMILDAQHPYNAVLVAFMAWAKAEKLVFNLLKDAKYGRPPPDEGYAFDLTI